MPTISVRISNQLKKEMDKYKHINWSEIMRNAITKEISHQNEKNLAKAVLLNEQVRKTAPDGFNSVDIIRKFRESRH